MEVQIENRHCHERQANLNLIPINTSHMFSFAQSRMSRSDEAQQEDTTESAEFHFRPLFCVCLFNTRCPPSHHILTVLVLNIWPVTHVTSFLNIFSWPIFVAQRIGQAVVTATKVNDAALIFSGWMARNVFANEKPVEPAMYFAPMRLHGWLYDA